MTNQEKRHALVLSVKRIKNEIVLTDTDPTLTWIEKQETLDVLRSYLRTLYCCLELATLEEIEDLKKGA